VCVGVSNCEQSITEKFITSELLKLWIAFWMKICLLKP